jgi:hypothetical protein
VRRIRLNDAFREFVEKAGMPQDAAVAEIYQQTSRSDGELDLYCNGKLFERWKIRRFLRFELGDNEIVVNGQIGLGWGRVDHGYVLELDADQVEARVAKLTKPESRGRPEEYSWVIIDPLIDIEIERKGKNIAAVVRATLERCRRVWKGVPLPSLRRLQERVNERLRVRGN